MMERSHKEAQDSAIAFVLLCFFVATALRGFARKDSVGLLLCATSVCSVPLWFIIAHKNNHRDTEHTEVAQRRARMPTFRAKPL